VVHLAAKLSMSQQLALAHITEYAQKNKHESDSTIAEIVRMCNLDKSTLDRAVTKLKTHARVALHFHPDRPDPTMTSVA